MFAFPACLEGGLKTIAHQVNGAAITNGSCLFCTISQCIHSGDKLRTDFCVRSGSVYSPSPASSPPSSSSPSSPANKHRLLHQLSRCPRHLMFTSPLLTDKHRNKRLFHSAFSSWVGHSGHDAENVIQRIPDHQCDRTLLSDGITDWAPHPEWLPLAPDAWNDTPIGNPRQTNHLGVYPVFWTINETVSGGGNTVLRGCIGFPRSRHDVHCFWFEMEPNSRFTRKCTICRGVVRPKQSGHQEGVSYLPRLHLLQLLQFHPLHLRTPRL